MAWHMVAAAEEIPIGGRKIVSVGRRSLGIFNVDGKYYALNNVCVHQGAQVCRGRVSGSTLPSRVGEFKYGLEGRVLRCPWHGWEYDIFTGMSLFDDKTRVVSFPAEERDGQVLVLLPGPGERPPTKPGPPTDPTAAATRGDVLAEPPDSSPLAK